MKRIDHVAVAVERVRDVLPLYQDLLGGKFIDGGDHLEQAYRWVQFEYPGGFRIEIMEPLSDDCFLRRFLDGHGPGMHHILLDVDDIEEKIAEAEKAGYAVVQADLREKGWNEAFLHPRSTQGVLIEFGEVKGRVSAPPTDEQGEAGQDAFPYTLDEVLDGVFGGRRN